MVHRRKSLHSTHVLGFFHTSCISLLSPAGVGIKWKCGILDVVALFDLQKILILIQIHENENNNTILHQMLHQILLIQIDRQLFSELIAY